MRRFSALVLLPGAVALAAACGGGDDSSGGAPDASIDSTASQDAAPAPDSPAETAADAPTDRGTDAADAGFDASATSFHGFLIDMNETGLVAIQIDGPVFGSSDAGPTVLPATATYQLHGGTPQLLTGTYDRSAKTLTASNAAGASISAGLTIDVFNSTLGGVPGAPLFEAVADPEITYCGTVAGTMTGFIGVADWRGGAYRAVSVGISIGPQTQVYDTTISDGGFSDMMNFGLVVNGTLGAGAASGTWTQPGQNGTWTATASGCP
jgi:hypothetical protein